MPFGKLSADELGNSNSNTVTVASLYTLTSGAPTFAGDITIPDKIIHAGDTNTAIRFPSADTFAIETAGTERLRIDASGNVGIGTTSPSQILELKAAVPKLCINGTTSDAFRGIEFDYNGTQYGSILFNQGNGDLTISSGDTGSGYFINFKTNNTERMRIDPSGNVGIGSTNPSQFLELESTSNTTARVSAHGYKCRNNWGSVTSLGNGMMSPADNALAFTTNSVERFRIDGSGRLLIGATSGSELLEVHGDTARLKLRDTSAYSVGTGPAVQFQGNDSGGTIRNFAEVRGVSNSASNEGELSFVTRNSSNSNERVRIDSSGNVGVGTTSPSYKLDLYRSGSGIVSRFGKETIYGEFNVTGDTVGFQGTRSSDSAVTGFFIHNPGNTGTSNFDHVSVQTAGSERLRIDSSGRLLINHTADTAPNGYASKLQLCDTSYQGSSMLIRRDSNDSSGPVLLFAKSRSSSKGGSTSLQSGDVTGEIVFWGADGVDTNSYTALIQSVVDGTPGNNDMPGRLGFFTTSDGGSISIEKMRLSATGDLLSLSSDNGVVSRSTISAGTSNTVFIGQYNAGSITSGTNCFKVFTNGNVQNSNNSYGQLSDIKLKENIVAASSQWDDIKDVQVRNFNFKEGDTQTQIGVVAQEIEEVSPGLIYEVPDRDEDNNILETSTKAVKYSVLYMKAIKALQEAMERIETLEARCTTLENNN